VTGLGGVGGWWRGRAARREHREQVALAARLRRDLVDAEARLARAAAAYEGASLAALAAAPEHAALAHQTRRLTEAAFELARRRVSLHAGTLHALEQALAER
jgi:hypothetical protein